MLTSEKLFNELIGNFNNWSLKSIFKERRMKQWERDVFH